MMYKRMMMILTLVSLFTPVLLPHYSYYFYYSFSY